MPEDGKLIIEIKNSHPVELLDLTRSLVAVGREYQDYADLEFDGPYRTDTRLFVKEIRTGSIITELQPYAVALLPILSDVNTVLGFAKHLKAVIDWLRRPFGADRPEIRPSTLQNVSSILEPIAKDSASQININTIVVHHAPVTININSADANAIQNQAHRELDFLKAPIVGLHENVVMYWWQARNDLHSRAGDRAIIESISEKPVKVVFASEKLKAAMLRLDENLFKHAFLVDVHVETVDNRPALYRVINLHEELEKPK